MNTTTTTQQSHPQQALMREVMIARTDIILNALYLHMQVTELVCAKAGVMSSRNLKRARLVASIAGCCARRTCLTSGNVLDRVDMQGDWVSDPAATDNATKFLDSVPHIRARLKAGEAICEELIDSRERNGVHSWLAKAFQPRLESGKIDAVTDQLLRNTLDMYHPLSHMARVEYEAWRHVIEPDKTCRCCDELDRATGQPMTYGIAIELSLIILKVLHSLRFADSFWNQILRHKAEPQTVSASKHLALSQMDKYLPHARAHIQNHPLKAAMFMPTTPDEMRHKADAAKDILMYLRYR